MPATATPLAGLKVLELSHAIMGPTAGLVLADLGADVLLENYGPGTMERLGCGYDVLAKVNPRLIYLALKGYLPGPYEKRPALDEVVQFQAGLAYMTGPPGRPLRAGASIIDILGAVFGIVAVQAALRERDKSGEGQLVTSALFETAVFLMSNQMAGIQITGQPMPPMPARRGAWGVYDVFEADGGSLFIGVTSDQQWGRFVEEFGLAELAKDPRLADNVKRVGERSWLIPALQEVLKGLSKVEVERRCERANVSWAPVGTPMDLFEDAHLLASNGLLDVALASAGGGAGRTAKLPSMPLAFGVERKRVSVRRQPPRVGEHNGEVLAEAGFTAAEIKALEAAGALVAI